MVVDGAGYLGSALIGDHMAALAINHGWAGIVIFGALRDSDMLSGMKIGVKALGTNPKKSGKHGVGGEPTCRSVSVVWSTCTVDLQR